MQVEVLKKDGSPSGEKVTLDPAIFGVTPNDHAIYMAVRSFMANQRQGTHKVKPRNEVRGGGRKPYRQKKTGRARAGTIRSPLWVGGGSIFGPQPHDYVVKVPAKMRRLARVSALSLKAKAAAIKVVEDFTFDQPKTKEMAGVLKALALAGTKTLFLTPGKNDMILRSGRNIPRLSIREAASASTYDIVNHQTLVLQKSALKSLEESLRKAGKES
ncbi:MAG: 50S ribosomal protein L4 [Ignavibacteriales bacterium]|jgi:large subunit ribosomal protein L4|nr:50S ribosomal protein L4 [Ignavibacteriales bacterium]